jgi:hypothetical protein
MAGAFSSYCGRNRVTLLLHARGARCWGCRLRPRTFPPGARTRAMTMDRRDQGGQEADRLGKASQPLQIDLAPQPLPRNGSRSEHPPSVDEIPARVEKRAPASPKLNYGLSSVSVPGRAGGFSEGAAQSASSCRGRVAVAEQVRAAGERRSTIGSEIAVGVEIGTARGAARSSSASWP